MGNNNSSESKSDNDNDNCNWEDIGIGGCAETVKGSDVIEIAKCKNLCLDDLINKLKKNKNILQKEIDELNIKLNRLKDPTISSGNLGIGGIKNI